MISRYRRAGLALVAVAAAACSRQPSPSPAASPEAEVPVRVTDIDVGRGVANPNGLTEATHIFTPGENFVVAVKTEGSAPAAKVAAVWTYEDQRVTESEQTIQPQGPAVVTFELPKPEGPNAAWPSGDYKVKILLNGVLAGSESFEVRPPSK
ncbi:MAG TPA: hypothetical protein VF310_15245 [Vicinamibacteria bacterium]